MRLSNLNGKEIINICSGTRIGTAGVSDAYIDEDSGEVINIVVPCRKNIINMWFQSSELVIPWDMVKKIGHELIMVELDQTHMHSRRIHF